MSEFNKEFIQQSNDTSSSFEESLTLPLKINTIQNINFTNRELDVIACIISGRATKKIAAFLSISPNTVDIHIQNIMAKLNCNSRENIIDFIEKSNKFDEFKKHYFNLLINLAFVKTLKKISTVTRENNINCLVFYYRTQRAKVPFIHNLEKHLKLLGINSVSKVWEKGQSSTYINNNFELGKLNHIIYFVDDVFIERLQASEDKLVEETKNLISNCKDTANPIIFISLNNNGKNFYEHLTNLTHINLLSSENYYFLFFELLKKLLISHNIDKYITEFKEQSVLFNGSSPLLEKFTPDSELSSHKRVTIKAANITNLNKLRKIFSFKWVIFIISPICFSFVIFNINKEIRFLTIKTQKVENKVDVNYQAVAADPAKAVAKTLFNIPQRNNNFTGRNAALQQIKKQFDKNILGMNIQIISGLGGIGKTQLATEYAYNSIKENYYDVVIWLTAETHNALYNAYKELAEVLHIDTRKLTVNEIQKLVYNKIVEKHHGAKILIILDNAKNSKHIRKHFNELHKHLATRSILQILVTSRSQDWAENLLILDNFTKEESFAFIKSYLPEENERSIDTLGRNLDYFPLALSHAVAYIKAHTNINDYLTIYTTKKLGRLNKFPINNKQIESVWKTWDISLAKLSTNAQKLLFISAYLNPDEIPLDFFSDLSVNERMIAIGELRKYSFITLTNTNNSFKIHRLLQECIRLTTSSNVKNTLLSVLKTGHPNTKTYWLNYANKLLQNKFNFHYLQPAKWTAWTKYLAHAHTIANHFLQAQGNSLKDGINLYAKTAMFTTHILLGSTDSINQWLKLLNLVKKNYSKNTNLLLLANINTNLSIANRIANKDKKAIIYANRAIAIYQQNNHKTTKKVAKLLNILRLIPLNERVNLSNAIKYDQGYALTQLGNIFLYSLGNNNDAILNYNKALASFAQINDINVVKYNKMDTLYNLSMAEIYSNDLMSAEKHIQIAANIADQIYKNHQQQAFTYTVLALFKNHIGKFQEADKLLKITLDILLPILSTKHFIINTTKVNIGLNAYMLGDIQIAKAYLEEALLYWDNLWIAKFYLARIYEQLGQYDNALKSMNESFEIISSSHKENLHDFMKFQISRAENWQRVPENCDIHYLASSLELAINFFGKNHYQVARCHYMLGQALANKHQISQAKKQYEKSLLILKIEDVKHHELIKFHKQNLDQLQSSIHHGS